MFSKSRLSDTNRLLPPQLFYVLMSELNQMSCHVVLLSEIFQLEVYDCLCTLSGSGVLQFDTLIWSLGWFFTSCRAGFCELTASGETFVLQSSTSNTSKLARLN